MWCHSASGTTLGRSGLTPDTSGARPWRATAGKTHSHTLRLGAQIEPMGTKAGKCPLALKKANAKANAEAADHFQKILAAYLAPN